MTLTHLILLKFWTGASPAQAVTVTPPTVFLTGNVQRSAPVSANVQRSVELTNAAGSDS